MAAFETFVTVGQHEVKVSADNLEDLIKRVSYLQELARDAHGVNDATFFYRRAGKHDYFGLQRFRKNGESWERQEVQFGKLQEPPLGPDYRLFAYGRGSEAYDEKGGWRWYNPDTEKSEARERRQK